jgi:phenylacetate-CoA ligase
MRGHYLARWRYGPETESLVAEALDREQWSADRWQTFQAERLARILTRAARNVPYYREQWAARRRRGDRSAVDVLENWPILEKESLRTHPAAFLAEDCNPRKMFREYTSGTSGTSIDLWWSRETVRAWYALFEARCRRWYGVSRRSRWAILGGQLVTPASNRRPPFWVWNSGLNQLYMSSYHLAPDLIPAYLDALRRYNVEYLFGYTSSLYALAEECVRLGRGDLRFKVAITNAEPLFDHQRELIEAAFQCPVRETYGMAEIVAAASECTAGRMHIWPEVGHIEVIGDGGVAVAEESGDLVCTGLLNPDMPLIRYRIGDRGAFGSSRACTCGRTLPALARIDGRIDDVLYTVDGRAIGRLDPVFKGRLPIREAQIIQEALDRVRVRYVPAPDFSPWAVASMSERLRDRLGPVHVVTEEVKSIPRTTRGKFRSVICQVPAEQLARAGSVTTA